MRQAIAIILTAALCGACAPGPQPGADLVSVTLRHQPDGTARLAWDVATHEITVAMVLSGLLAHSTHAVDLDDGQCEAPGPGPAIDLPDANAKSDGSIAATLHAAAGALTGLPAPSFLAVHLGPRTSYTGPADAGSNMIACADIVSASSAPLNLVFGAPPALNAAGVASFRLDRGAKRTVVDLRLSGLAATTPYAAEIVSGACDHPGAVLRDLPDVAADAGGNATAESVESGVTSLPSGPSHLAVLMGSRSLVSAGGYSGMYAQPLLCGDIVNSAAASCAASGADTVTVAMGSALVTMRVAGPVNETTGQQGVSGTVARGISIFLCDMGGTVLTRESPSVSLVDTAGMRPAQILPMTSFKDAATGASAHGSDVNLVRGRIYRVTVLDRGDTADLSFTAH